MSLLNRIRRSLAQRGLWETVKLCCVCVSPGALKREFRERQIDADFDNRYGVDTGGTRRPGPDEVLGEHWSLSTHYAAVEPDEFHAALRQVPIEHAEHVFIDFGSGKGRTLLLASEYPFRKIIGVEFCPDLNRIARENVRRYPASASRLEDVEIVDADAGAFPIPDEPLVLFLNNPFAGPLMERVVRNVEESFHRNPRRIVVIYFWPFYAGVWERASFLSRVHGTPAIFDSHPGMVEAVMRGRQSASGHA